MSRIRSAARFIAKHWLLVLAIAGNLAIAAPVDAVRYDNDVCENSEGGLVPCCTTCWFFCHCDYGEDPPPPPPPAP